MALLLGFAFLSGLVTILAPCIWPLLPIVLSASATGGHRKPLGITLGIIITFAIVTLSISYIIKIIPFDPNALRLFAAVVIGFLGLTLVVPALSEKVEGFVSRLSEKINIQNKGSKNGFLTGIITGSALGIVWTPCAGPILATIATLSATQSVNSSIILVTVVYAIGIGIPLFAFASLGRHIFSKSKSLSPYLGRIQQIFGAIMILTSFLIFTNYDKVLQARLLNAFPSYGNLIKNIGFENNAKVKEQLDSLKNRPKSRSPNLEELFNTNQPAPEFVGITKWLNTDRPLTLKELKGKVVLVDFWTYTCINCIRTLPHVTSWYDKYKDQGFVVIGVHTPEFEFEKKSENVLNAIKQYNIHYPVPQDNGYATWNNYNNQYWPAEYLVDAKGIIRRTHFGEGKYDETERAIQELLKEAGKQVNSSLESMPDQTPKTRNSPETYLGSARMKYYYPGGSISNGQQSFTFSDNLPKNSFSFGGEWNITDEQAIAGKNATLNYNFYANKVFLVIKPPKGNSSTKVKVFLDSKLADNNSAGEDVKNGEALVNEDRLYNLIDLKGKTGNHILRLEFQTSGIEVFAFTFG